MTSTNKRLKTQTKTRPPLSSNPMEFDIEGCEEISWFQVEDRNQYILLIGEDHKYKGNSLEFIRDLVSISNCPIDIIIEDDYQTFWESEYDFSTSNASRFRSENKNVCFHPNHIPPKLEDLHLPKYRDYYSNCVKPYQGKVKIWADDIRQTSIFKMFAHSTFTVYEKFLEKFGGDISVVQNKIKRLYNTSSNFRLYITRVKLVLKSFFHFDLYNMDPSKYHENIMNELLLLAEAEGLYTTEHFNRELLAVLASKDKSHIHFAQEMTKHFSPLFLNTLKLHFDREIDKNNFENILLNVYIFDIAILLRIRKLLKKKKEGLIVCFIGYTHLRNLEKLMEFNDLSTVKFIHRMSKKCNASHKIKWNNPISLCEVETELMKKYKELKQQQQLKTKSKKKTKSKQRQLEQLQERVQQLII